MSDIPEGGVGQTTLKQQGVMHIAYYHFVSMTRLLTVEQAAEEDGVAEGRMRQEIGNGQVIAFKVPPEEGCRPRWALLRKPKY